MALWGGRFTQAADQRFKQFNDSLRFDYRLAEQDIVGSVAWSKALVTVGVLSAAEQQQLEEALNVLLEEVRANPQQILASDAEDIHSWVEGKLIDKVGQLGKKLHTGAAVTTRSPPILNCGAKIPLSNCSQRTASCRARWWRPPSRIRTR